MVDGRIDGSQPVVRTSGTTRGDSKPKVIAKLKPGESLFTKKGTDRGDGKRTDIIFKDFNSDGVITEDELYLIDHYSKEADGAITVKRYKDNDGDGYSDSVTTFEYDKDGNKVDKQIKNEVNINSVSGTDQGKRKMSNLRYVTGELTEIKSPQGTVSVVNLPQPKTMKVMEPDGQDYHEKRAHEKLEEDVFIEITNKDGSTSLIRKEDTLDGLEYVRTDVKKNSDGSVVIARFSARGKDVESALSSKVSGSICEIFVLDKNGKLTQRMQKVAGGWECETTHAY